MASRRPQSLEVIRNTFHHTAVQIAQGVINVNINLGNRKTSAFNGVERLFTALSLLFVTLFNFSRGYPFRLGKAFMLIFLYILGDRAKIEQWFKEWCAEIDVLAREAKTEKDLDKLAAGLWLPAVIISEMINFYFTKNQGLTDEIFELLTNCQQAREILTTTLAEYSTELSRKYKNIENLQRIYPFIGSKDLEAIGKLTIKLANFTRIDSYTPYKLIKTLDKYIQQNPERVSPFSLTVVKRFRNLLVWVLQQTSSLEDSLIQNLLEKFSDIEPRNPSNPGSGGFPSNPGSKGSPSKSLDRIEDILIQAREWSKEVKNLQEKIERLEQELAQSVEKQKPLTANNDLEYRNSNDKVLIDKTLTLLNRFISEKPDLVKQIKLEKEMNEARKTISKLEQDNKDFKRELEKVREENRTLEQTSRMLSFQKFQYEKEVSSLREENSELRKSNERSSGAKHLDIGYEQAPVLGQTSETQIPEPLPETQIPEPLPETQIPETPKAIEYIEADSNQVPLQPTALTQIPLDIDIEAASDQIRDLHISEPQRAWVQHVGHNSVQQSSGNSQNYPH